MNVVVVLEIQKLFWMLKVHVSGELNVGPSAGAFAISQIKKRIVRSIEDSGAKGTVSIDGENNIIN